MRITFVILLFISVFSINKTTAQEKEHQNFYLEPVYQYGFIWQHRPSLADVIGGSINVARISLGQETYGKSYWEQLYRYPDWGIGYSFTDLGNPDELGQANAVYYYLRIPAIKKPKFSLNYKISGGMAYLNQGNIAIGSHLNLYFDFSLDTKLKLGKRLELINAFGATHYSNGAIDMPNLGVNLFSYRLGLQYKLNSTPREKITLEVPELESKHCISVVAGAGVKEQRPLGGEKLTVASGSVDYLKPVGIKHKFGGGLDIFYDESLYHIIDSVYNEKVSDSEIMRYGVHISGEARYKRLVVAVHIGTYLKAKYTGDGKIYQRVAIRYLFTEKLFANISLKTSKGIADFVEWGLGYQICWK